MSTETATDSGMSTTTKVFLWAGGIALAAYLLPRLLDSAANNPERLRRSARAIRSGRDQALRASRRGVSRAGRYLSEKFAD